MSKGRSVTPRVTADVPEAYSEQVQSVFEIDRLFWLDPANRERKQFERRLVAGEALPHQDFDPGTIPHPNGTPSDLPYTRVLVQRWGRSFHVWNGKRWAPALDIVDNDRKIFQAPSHKRADKPEVVNPVATSKGAIVDYRFTMSGLLNERRRRVQQPKPMGTIERMADGERQRALQAERRQKKGARRAILGMLKTGKLDFLAGSVSEPIEVHARLDTSALTKALDEGRAKYEYGVDGSGNLHEVSIVPV